MSAEQPGRVIEAQSSYTRVHQVLLLVLLTPLKWSGESAHVRQNYFSAHLALIIMRLGSGRVWLCQVI